MSDEQDESSKTEEPTQKRLDEAHDRGQFAVSREVGNWSMLVATLALMLWWAPPTMRWLQVQLAALIEHSWQVPTDRGGIGLVLLTALRDTGLALAIPVLLLMAVGVGSSLLQTGWRPSSETLKPSFGKLNPLANLKNILSANNLVEQLKGLIKITIVGAAAFTALMPMFTGVEHFAGLPIPIMLKEMDRLAFRLVIAVLLIMTLIMGLDVVYQRFSFMKKMRMTKQEVKDEFKQSEGDPVVKGRLRQIRMERARHRMMSAVPKADVVVTNPTHFAVALKYDPATMGAPMVLAKGVDQIAVNIRKVAEANDVPIMENPPLARALYATVEVDQEIPPEHYRAVAEIITYVFKLKKRSLKGSP